MGVNWIKENEISHKLEQASAHKKEAHRLRKPKAVFEEQASNANAENGVDDVCSKKEYIIRKKMKLVNHLKVNH